MNKQRMIEWICTHQVGVSSRTMWTGLMEVDAKPTYGFVTLNIPYDCDDFSRCHDLVKYCEVDPALDFPKILQRFPWYAPILSNWGKLTAFYEAGQYENVTEVLSSLRDEANYIKQLANGNK